MIVNFEGMVRKIDTVFLFFIPKKALLRIFLLLKRVHKSVF